MLHPVPLSKCLAVIGSDYDHGVVVQIALLQARHHFAHLRVRVRDSPVVLGNAVGPVIRGQGAALGNSVLLVLQVVLRDRGCLAGKLAVVGRRWNVRKMGIHVIHKREEWSGSLRALIQRAEEFIVTPEKVWTLAAGNGENYIRWIYTDGSGHSAKESEFPKWHGESIGFWDRDALIIHTNQIRGWKGGLSEFTDRLETVERYRRAGNMIEGEITLYDPEVFVQPVNAKMRFTLARETRPELRPLYNTCSDTNGPSAAYFMDERGKLNQRLPGDPLYWDATDARPWGSWLSESDKRYAR